MESIPIYAVRGAVVDNSSGRVHESSGRLVSGIDRPSEPTAVTKYLECKFTQGLHGATIRGCHLSANSQNRKLEIPKYEKVI